MANIITSEYETDFYLWTSRNAQLLRERRFNEIDFENIAEEIEDMGGNRKRELRSRLSILLAHLLKWKFQPMGRCSSWKYTIDEQRDELIDLLTESPSLQYELEQKLQHAYKYALRQAEKDTAINRKNFPQECPFSLGEVLDEEFSPE